MKFLEHARELAAKSMELVPSQRAIIAARVKADFVRLRIRDANGKRDSTKLAAELFGVSAGAINLADKVLRLADDTIIELVEAGHVSLFRASNLLEVSRYPRLSDLRRVWRQCSPVERQRFIEENSGKISELLSGKAAS